ncbi:MAG: ATP-binding protein [Clostridia bacterium]|nr:ATP-binding protein [Clostridia bacterium]
MTRLGECLEDELLERNSRPGVTRKEWEEAQVRRLNEDAGGLNRRDGIDCPRCRNKGWLYRNTEEGLTALPCDCLRRREIMRRIDESGLGQSIRAYTFDRFADREDWQKTMKQTAQAFCADENARWFYIGGQPGSGKTHLCTAICDFYIRRGLDTRYLLWAEKSKQLKAAVNDSYRSYAAALEEYKRIPVLYIDDFLKVRQGGVPSDGDLNLAFELINARLLSPDRITVISSEKTLEEAMTYDEATISRIAQQCGKYRIDVDWDREKNYRLRG